MNNLFEWRNQNDAAKMRLNNSGQIWTENYGNLHDRFADDDHVHPGYSDSGHGHNYIPNPEGTDANKYLNQQGGWTTPSASHPHDFAPREGDYNEDFYAANYYVRDWFRNQAVNEGMYNQETGAHWYSSADGVWDLTGNDQNQATRLNFRGKHNGNIEGAIYADGGSWFGFLNDAGQWQLRTMNVDTYSPSLYFDEQGNETWTGDPDNDVGKIEYHSNKFYIVSGANSTEIVRFRKSGEDKAFISEYGYFYSPRYYDKDNPGYYIDPASISIVNDFRANIFYDRDNTGFYLDPAGESRVNSIVLNGVGYLHTGDKARSGEMNNYSFAVWGGQEGMSMESNHNEGAGIQVNGQNIIMWTPCDYHCIRVIDEDGRTEIAYMNYSGSWHTASDIRWKENIEPIQGALSKVLQLRGVQYYRKMLDDKKIDRDNRRLELGFIAQEMEPIIPELVDTNERGYKSVSYSNMSAVLVQATKELKLEKDENIASLNNKIEQLKTENESLRTTLLELIKRVEELEGK